MSAFRAASTAQMIQKRVVRSSRDSLSLSLYLFIHLFVSLFSQTHSHTHTQFTHKRDVLICCLLRVTDLHAFVFVFFSFFLLLFGFLQYYWLKLCRSKVLTLHFCDSLIFWLIMPTQYFITRSRRLLHTFWYVGTRVEREDWRVESWKEEKQSSIKQAYHNEATQQVDLGFFI